MICDSCGHDNPGGKLHCEQCGSKIDYSRDRVESELAEKANRRAEQNLERELRNILALVIAVFLVTLTARLMFGSGDWPRPLLLPSSTRTSPRTVQEYHPSPADLVPEDRVKKLPLPESK